MLKISLLVDLGVLAPLGLLLGQALSRVVPVVQLGFQPYARREDPSSKSRDVARSGRVQAVVAALWGIAFLVLAGWLGVSMNGLIGMLGAMIGVGLLFGVYVQRRTGGLTGDFMGALQQLSELGILFALVAA